ncbi:MAG: hypothetical protein EP343_30755 [Deltaproteobacteria bacterium]|nr:MAG: hypothetical protein EP343_30755 [Deltaproteobacteria bacterium]
MSQAQSSSRKTWGFLAFTLGCIVAISGAAKLHPNDRTMRTRGLLVNVAKKKVAKASGPSAQAALNSLVAARLDNLSVVQVKQLLQRTYSAMQQQTAKALKIKEPAATMGVLETRVMVAMVKKWVAKPAPAGKAKKQNIQRDVIAAVVKTIGASPKKAKQTKKGSKAKTTSKPKKPMLALQVPRALKEIVSVLRDKTVSRLSPYIVWYALQKQAAGKVMAMAHGVGSANVMTLARAALKDKGASQGVDEFASTLSKSLGKTLKLKSKDYAVVVPPVARKGWVKALEPKLTNAMALQRAREVAHSVATLVGGQYATHLAKSLGTTMRLEWKAVGTSAQAASAKTQTPPAKQDAKVKKAPTSRAASQPAATKKAALVRRPAPRAAAPAPATYLHLALGGTKERIGGWPDSLPVFLVGFLLALFGLFQWRSAVQAEAAAQADKEGTDSSNPFALLAKMQGPLQQLQDDIGDLNEQQVCDRVDVILNHYVLPFAEVRRGVIDRLGMELGAEVLVIIAYGERMLNRVWSAASDGHLPEATSVLPDAVDALAEAAGKVKAAGALPSLDSTDDSSSEETSTTDSDEGDAADEDKKA